MTITVPKPIITPVIKPFVPNIIGVGILAAQLLVMSVGNGNEPHCKLMVEIPHYSTSMKRDLDADSIKLNITSECTVPQKETTLSGHIYMAKSGQEVTAYKFRNETRNSDPKNSMKARFLNLYAICVFGQPVRYRGDASGFAILKNGSRVPINASSKISLPEGCVIQAQ